MERRSRLATLFRVLVVLGLVAAFSLPVAAMAQEDSTTATTVVPEEPFDPGSSVGGTQAVAPAPAAAVAGAQETSSGSELPFTGSSLTLVLLAVGLAVLVAGVALTRAARVRAQQQR